MAFHRIHFLANETPSSKSLNHFIIIAAIIASPGGKTFAGKSYVVFGQSSFANPLELASLDGMNGFVIEGINAYDNSGSSVSGAGDLNGDGIDDVIIGAYYADPDGKSDADEAYVIFGRRAATFITPQATTLPLEAFPNPATEAFTVRLPELHQITDLSLHVFDLLGREVAMDYNRTGDSLQLNIAALPKGSYVLRMQVGEDMGTVRFVKE
jgi:hypothetical protein